MNKFSYVSKSSFFFLNFINCFEEGENGNLIVDLVSYESPQILENMYLDKLRQGKFENDDKSAIHRYILPLGITDKVEGKVWYFSVLVRRILILRANSNILLLMNRFHILAFCYL